MSTPPLLPSLACVCVLRTVGGLVWRVGSRWRKVAGSEVMHLPTPTTAPARSMPPRERTLPRVGAPAAPGAPPRVVRSRASPAGRSRPPPPPPCSGNPRAADVVDQRGEQSAEVGRPQAPLAVLSRQSHVPSRHVFARRRLLRSVWHQLRAARCQHLPSQPRPWLGRGRLAQRLTLPPLGSLRLRVRPSRSAEPADRSIADH
jgi:hypothetical protein